MSSPVDLDVVIFGGGAAGLWLLDILHRAQHSALLLEAHDLGSGQTIASQGIIHGGLKYTLSGLFTPSAKAIREMPLLWRRCLAGEGPPGAPDLSNTRLRAEFCHLWRTDTIGSRLGMIGARAGLRVAPRKLDAAERPHVLADCPGTVARLDEQVIEPASFLENLARQQRARLLQIDAAAGLEIVNRKPGEIELIRLINPATGDPFDLAPMSVIFLAGGGNHGLRELAGLMTPVMQRRPLHMVMARGVELPILNGHCVDRAATRLTITSTRDFSDRIVWQIGGQVAEAGVEFDVEALIARTRDEVREVLPGVDLRGVEWSAYRVDRAEGEAGGRRPEEARVLREGNTITGWPTKLALVPHLAERIAGLVGARRETASAVERPAEWPRPCVALPPWETEATWFPEP